MRLSCSDLKYCKEIRQYDSDRAKYPFITYFPESLLSKEASELDKSMIDAIKPLVDSAPSVDVMRQRPIEALTTCLGFNVSNEIIESLNCIKVEPTFSINSSKNDDNNNINNNLKNGFILDIHGGGFIAGTAHQQFIYPLARYTGCTVYSIEYNVAPETCINDTINNIIKIYDNIILNNKYNWNENNAILTGTSAGGGYVLMVLQRLRDRLKETNNNKNKNQKNNDKKVIGLPCAVFVKSPWTDLNNKYTKECHKYNDKLDAILSTKGLKNFAKIAIENEMKKMSEMKDGMETNEEIHSLLLNEYSAINDDFDGLSDCSMYFSVGASEVLLDDTILCAKKAYDKNVNVSVELHPFLWHACTNQANLCQESLAIIIRVSKWIVEQLNKRKQLPLTVQLKSML